MVNENREEEELLKSLDDLDKMIQKEYAKDEDYIYVQQSEIALLHYAKEKVPQYDWTYKLPTVIDEEPEEDRDFYSEDVRLPFRLTEHIFNKKITYYKIEYSPNDEDIQKKFPTVVYGFERKFMNFIYEDIITELTKYHVIYIRYMEKNKGKVYTNLNSIDKIFIESNEYLTFYYAICKLYDKFNKHLSKDCFIEKILELRKQIENSNIRDYRIGFNNKTINKLDLIEKNLIMIRLKVLFDRINSLVTISEATIKLKVNSGTIKNACQTEKLLNTKKIGKTWLVDIDEIIEMRESNKKKKISKLEMKKYLIEMKCDKYNR